MHKQLLIRVIANCRRRIQEGDCPTVEPIGVETLENAVVELADRVMALEPKPEAPTAFDPTQPPAQALSDEQIDGLEAEFRRLSGERHINQFAAAEMIRLCAQAKRANALDERIGQLEEDVRRRSKSYNELHEEKDALAAEVERLCGEVASRNQRALDGDEATAAFNAEYDRAERERIAKESAERQRDVAVGAFNKYGQHKASCAALHGELCICLYLEAIKEVTK